MAGDVSGNTTRNAASEAANAVMSVTEMGTVSCAANDRCRPT